MQERPFTNSTQINRSSEHNVSLNTTPHYGNKVSIPVNSDVNNNLGYGMGRVSRAAFDYVHGAWQTWWHPGPSAARVAEQRQAAIYRAGLDDAIKQLNLALENLRKNPRAVSSLELFKQVVHDQQKYLQPVPTEKLRTYQTRLFHQLRNKIQQLKLPQLRETVLAYLQAEGNVLATEHSVSPIPTETLNTQTKRSITSQPSSVPPVPQSTPTNPVVFQKSFNLTTLNGSNGFAIPGLNEGDYLGNTVGTAGDINGDGLSDLVLGAFQASPSGRNTAGTAYVLLGQASGWPAEFNLTTLNGSNGFAIPGLNEGDYLGNYVSTAGDINGDGLYDLVLGAFKASSNDRSTGTAYVLLGQASGWPAQFNLATLNGSNGFAIPGISADSNLGTSVNTAGDINGDKLSDLVLGDFQASPDGRSYAGTVYVLLGQASGWPAQFNLATLNGSNGFIIPGLNENDNLGCSVSTAGDINGDKLSDLVLGAYTASPDDHSSAGTVYVLLGQASGWPAQFNLTTLNGSNGFAIPGINALDQLGNDLSMVDDINGDGLSDLMLGAFKASSNDRATAGTAYVLLGQASGWPAQFNLTMLNGSNGFAIPGLNAGDELGNSVSTAGDINGDGLSDLLLSAYNSRGSAGTAYVIFSPMLRSAHTPMFHPIPLPITSPNPMIAPQPAPSNLTISPEPTPSPIPQNLMACQLNQPLQWLYHDIIIASAQALRLSPLDISVACRNSSQPNLGAYFSVTYIQSATLQHRNASGGWNVGQLTFFGQDLATGKVALVQDGSAIAPELTVTATDGVTTLPNQGLKVQFTSINSSPVLVSFQLAIRVDGRVTLTSNDIVLRSSTEKLADLVITVSNVTQNGYFAQIDAPNVPITEFTGYQVQTEQIQVVHTGGNEPIHFNIKVSDGLKSSVAQSETVKLFGMPNNPVTQIGAIVGGAVAGGILLAGVLAAFGFYHYRLQHREKALNKLGEILMQH